MKPIVNLGEITDLEEDQNGGFQQKYSDVGGKIGAKRLGYNLTIVPPGKKASPFHNHRINEEMFLIVEGEGTLRFGAEEFPVKKLDVIACPAGGREVAHQLLNTGKTDLKYLALSTLDPYEIVEYPDSNKIMSFVGTYEKSELRFIARMDRSLDYNDGEK